MYSDAQRFNDPTQSLSFWEKWSPAVQLKIWLYFGCCFVALSLLPNTIWDSDAREIVYVIGFLGVWRYTWWFNLFDVSAYGTD